MVAISIANLSSAKWYKFVDPNLVIHQVLKEKHHKNSLQIHIPSNAENALKI
jgi:hypothetical protein